MLSKKCVFMIDHDYEYDSDDEKDDNIIKCKDVICNLCDEKYFYDDHITFINDTKNNTIIPKICTLECCYSLICPACVKHVDDTMEACHLFINTMIYIQHDEEDIRLGDCDDIQYRWATGNLIDKELLNKYTIVDREYNDYGVTKALSQESSYDLYYRNMCALCECKSCGYVCCAVIYMDS
jgi:hypothetical protein